MGSDLAIVFRWWGTLFLVGAVAFPLTKKLFSSWFDRGYLFSKAVGMATVTFFVYLAGTVHLLPFTMLSIVWAMIVTFGIGIWAQWKHNTFGQYKARLSVTVTKYGLLILLEELFFFAALLFWSWIKAHEPSIHGLEKFMDFGFTKSILNSAYFPAPDMWYAGFSINYYYFGHTVMAVLTRLSGLDLAYTFNLMLASIFAFTLTMSFSIGYQLLAIGSPGRTGIRGRVFGGLFTAFLVTLAGNMQTIYAFTKGYFGEQTPPPFWTLLWKFSELGSMGQGLDRYWYANATRFIPFTIHEFPSYSFVVSDVHGHVLSLPFVLLAIALLIVLFGIKNNGEERAFQYPSIFFYGFLCGVLLMTNASDGPIFLGLFLVLFTIRQWNFVSQWKKYWRQILSVFAAVTIPAVLASLPFMTHFTSFVSGLAVNCPPAFLADHKIGPILFEGVEKCQHSPLWMMWLLWGFFIYCGVFFITSKLQRVKTSKLKYIVLKTYFTQLDLLLVVFFIFSLLLIIFPEFFYFKDIYPAHFRSNTMFKLGYEAFIIFSIVSGYTIVQAISVLRSRITNHKSRITNIFFIVLLVPQLFLVSIFPYFSVRSYFGGLRQYQELYGLNWLKTEHPDDYEGIQWLNARVSEYQRINASTPVIVEADGDSYTDYERFSAFTGTPTVVGWAVHEWLWRGSYDLVSPRREDVRAIYESHDREKIIQLIRIYNVHYIIVGGMERDKYPDVNEDMLRTLGTVVFELPTIRIYEINTANL